MSVYLGLGSNLGNRKRFLKKAWDELKKILKNIKASSVYESRALLPEGAPNDWDKPFLNLVVCGEFSDPPEKLFSLIKNIENEIGRKPSARWAPREIDIDILLFNDEVIRLNHLKIPHPEISHRPFVLWPLIEINPSLDIKPKWQNTISTEKIFWRVDTPQIMGILNLTPDSFSDGGQFNSAQQVLEKAKEFIFWGATVLDLGAESTRPGAKPIGPKEEICRLEDVLSKILALEAEVSVDTYHYETAAWAIEKGVHWINDVGGLETCQMQELAQLSQRQFVFMHNLGLPADPQRTLSLNEDPVRIVKTWAQKKLAHLTQMQINPRQLIFDPGIGFGKTAQQNLEIISRIHEFQSLGLPILVGPSRKSYLKEFTDNPPHNRDIETLGTLLFLADQGVDYLRVHNVEFFRRALNVYWRHKMGSV